MSLRPALLSLCLLCAAMPFAHAADAPAAAAPADAATANAIAGTQQWWKAFSVNDAAYLQAHTAPDMALTLASGATFDHAGLLAESATFTNGARMRMDWASEAVDFPTPDIAIVRSRLTETAGPSAKTYRVITVLEQRKGAWWVSKAQTTRELALAPRVPLSDAGGIDDLVGTYLTPGKKRLQVRRTDAGLELLDPDGKAYPLEPIGPGLFEFGELSLSKGTMRFAFSRGADGKVVAMTRLLPNAVSVYPRAP
jgi:hypothetical protein